MSRFLDTLVRLSTRLDVHEMRALAPALDRTLVLKLASDRPDDGPEAWLANRVLFGHARPALTDTTAVEACMRVLARYIETSEYEADVGHALMHRLLYGDDPLDTKRRRRVVSIYVLAQLVRCGRSELLKRQFVFIGNDYVMERDEPASAEETDAAQQAQKTADLELQQMETEYHSLVTARQAKREALKSARVAARSEACWASALSQKKHLSAAPDEPAAAADKEGDQCRRLGWACADARVSEARSSLADTEQLLERVNSEIVEAKRAKQDRGRDKDRLLLALLTHEARALPVFDEMAERVPWCANVAGCLLRMALAHTNYNMVLTLLDCDAFYATVSASGLERASVGAASALLKLFRKQRDGLRETIAHIPTAATDSLCHAEAGFKGPVARNFGVLALVEQRARARETIAGSQGDDEACEKRRAKIAYDLLCEKIPTLQQEQKMTSLQTLLDIDEALAAALVSLRSQLTADAHMRALARIIDVKLPDHDELTNLPPRGVFPLLGGGGGGGDEASDSDADVDDKLPANKTRDALEISTRELEYLLRAAPKRGEPTHYLDTTVALAHALYRYRLVCLDERVSSARKELCDARQKTKEARKEHRVLGADELKAEVAQMTAADYFGFDDE